MLQKLPSEVIFFTSPVGDLKIEIVQNKIKGVQFIKSSSRGSTTGSTNGIKMDPAIKSRDDIRGIITAWLTDYFAGQSPTPFPWEWMDLSAGTLFQQKIWHTLWKIPPGQVISYKELATRAKSPKAHRAAGNANGKNPLPILIPCHRVIASDGKIGGYSCGVPIKQKLLKLEGHLF